MIEIPFCRGGYHRNDYRHKNENANKSTKHNEINVINDLRFLIFENIKIIRKSNFGLQSQSGVAERLLGSPTEKISWNRICQICKKIDVRYLFSKGCYCSLAFGQVMASDDMCDGLFYAIFNE